MPTVYVETRGYFECPKCGNESETDPMPRDGQTVVCEACGQSFRVNGSGYTVVDWNKRNRARAKTAK